MKKARKILFTLCAALLLVTMSVGATLAYLTSEDSVTNTFTTGKVEITLDEAVVKTELDDDGNTVVTTDRTEQGNNYTMFPGCSYKKDPTIHVLANSEDCYVAAEIVLTTKKNLLDKIEAEEGFIGFEELVSGGIFDGETKSYAVDGDKLVAVIGDWKLVQHKQTSATADNETTYTRVFHLFKQTKVEKNVDEQQDFVLFDNIQVPSTWDNDSAAYLNDMTMDVTAYAVQVVGMENCEDAMDKADYITE